jgi:superfamily II DNA or RNA helicase
MNSTTLRVREDIRLDRDVSRHLINKIRGILNWSNPAIGYKRARGWKIDPKVDRDIKGYRLTKSHLYIPRGFQDRLELLLKDEGIPYTIDDKRTWWNKVTPYVNTIELFQHQVRPIQEMLEYDEGLFEAPCGSGKSVMALYMLCKWGQPSLVLAHTNSIIEQWQEYVEKFTGMKAGLIHGNTFDVQPITIGSVMTLVNRELDSDFRRYFGAVILDEAHHTPAFSFQSVLSRFSARKRLGITATPRRADNLQGLLVAIAGPIRTKVDQEELFKTGFAIRPTVYTVKTNFTVKPEEEMKDEKLFAKLEDDTDRAILAAEVTYRSKDRHTLVLSRRIAHLDHIFDRLFDKDTTVRAEVLTGRVKPKLRKKIVRRLRRGKLNIVLATQLADEGLDIPVLDTVVLTFPASSEIKIEQQMGRPMRSYPGKKTVEIYDLVDHRVPRLMKQALKRMALYRRLRYPIVPLVLEE